MRHFALVPAFALVSLLAAAPIRAIEPEETGIVNATSPEAGILFGGQPTVWAPTAYQGYETIQIGGGLLRTPEEAFDFLVEQNMLPPELHFDWSEDSSLKSIFGFLLWGEGNVPWLVRDILKKAEPDIERRPRVVVG